MPQAEAEKKQADLEAKVASLTTEVGTAKAALEVEQQRTQAAVDAKIQSYNERINEVRLG